MQDIPQLRFVYLTLPLPTEPTLNLMIGNNHARFRVNRDQLFNLNAQIADALVRGRIDDANKFRDDGQLAMDLSAAERN